MRWELAYSQEAGIDLWMPEDFIGASESDISKAIGRGGCGPGKSGDKIVPDKIYGLNVHPACKRHDLGWFLAQDRHDTVVSNLMFLNNLLLLNDQSNKFIRFFRLKAPFGIYHYYEAVAYLGKNNENKKVIN